MKNNSIAIGLLACVLSIFSLVKSCKYYNEQTIRLERLKHEADSLQDVYKSLMIERVVLLD